MRSTATALLCLVPAVLVHGQAEGMEGLAAMLGGGGGGGMGDMLGNLFSGGGLGAAMGGPGGKAKPKKGSGDGCTFACPKPLKKMHDPKYKLWSNGCGAMGMNVDNGFDFKPCCDRHDACYETCGMDKASCDKLFKGCLNKTCRDKHGDDQACKQNSAMYTVGVTLMGCGSYRSGQEQACLCVAPDQLKHDRVSLLKQWHKTYDTKEKPHKWNNETMLTRHVNKLLFDYSKLKGLKTFPRLLMKLSKRWPDLVLILHGEKNDPNQPLIDTKRKDGTLLTAPDAQAQAVALGGEPEDDNDDDDDDDDGPLSKDGKLKVKRLPTAEEVAAREEADRQEKAAAKKAAIEARKLKASGEKTRLKAHRARKQAEKAKKADANKKVKQQRKSAIKEMKEYVKGVPVSGDPSRPRPSGEDSKGEDPNVLLDGAPKESELDDLMEEVTDPKEGDNKPCDKHKDCPLTHFCGDGGKCRECSNCKEHALSVNGKCPCGPARKRDKKAAKKKMKEAAEAKAAEAKAPEAPSKKDEL